MVERGNRATEDEASDGWKLDYEVEANMGGEEVEIRVDGVRGGGVGGLRVHIERAKAVKTRAICLALNKE